MTIENCMALYCVRVRDSVEYEGLSAEAAGALAAGRPETLCLKTLQNYGAQ